LWFLLSIAALSYNLLSYSNYKSIDVCGKAFDLIGGCHTEVS